jgi:hypothetical protein
LSARLKFRCRQPSLRHRQTRRGRRSASAVRSRAVTRSARGSPVSSVNSKRPERVLARYSKGPRARKTGSARTPTAATNAAAPARSGSRQRTTTAKPAGRKRSHGHAEALRSCRGGRVGPRAAPPRARHGFGSLRTTIRRRMDFPSTGYGVRPTLCWRGCVDARRGSRAFLALKTVMPVAGFVSGLFAWPMAAGLDGCPPPEAPIWISRSMRMPSQRVCLGSRSD